jgi:hypothetical protein
MSVERRLLRLEHLAEPRERTRLYGAIAVEFGLTVDALLDEAEAFFAQPLADQLAEGERIAAESEAEGIPWIEVDAIKAALVREYRP